MFDFYNYDVLNLKNTGKSTKPSMSKKPEVEVKKVEVVKEVVKEVEFIPNNFLEYNIDDIVDIGFNKYLYCIYQLELISKGRRIVYIGSTRSPQKRLKQHIIKLKANSHHNEDLQEHFNSFNAEELKYKFTVIDGTNKSEEIMRKEHRTLIEVASMYHRKMDRLGREIFVVNGK